MFLGLAGLALAALPHHAPPPVHHKVPVEQGDLHYRAVTRVAHKQVGMAPGPRQGVYRCAWETRVQVERRATAPDGRVLLMPRLLDGETRLTGSRPGECRAARPGIAADVARLEPRIAAHLAAAAERDHRAALAELERGGRLAAAD